MTTTPRTRIFLEFLPCIQGLVPPVVRDSFGLTGMGRSTTYAKFRHISAWGDPGVYVELHRWDRGMAGK